MIEVKDVHGTGVEVQTEEETWTNIQVDSSVLTTLMACERKCNLVYNLHYVPISGVPKSVEKGSLSHIGLHAYWASRIAGNDYKQASIDGLGKAKESGITFQNLPSEDQLEVYETLVKYFEFIQNLPWIPLKTEQFFKFKAYENENLKLRIYLTGRIDLIFKTPSNMIIPVDNKSESERWFYSQLSNQFKIYCLACNVNTLGVQRFGFQKTVEPKDKFKIEMLPFDPDVLNEFKNEVLPFWCKRLLLNKEEGYWAPNYSSCIHGHFGCQFSDKYNGGICNVSRSVRQQKIDRYFTIGEPWDPAEF